MLDKRDELKWLNTASLLVIAVVALAVALTYTRGIMIPFVMAVFIASAVSPVLDFQIIRLKFPRMVAVAVTLFIVVILIMVLCFLVARATQTIVATIGSYSEGFGKLTDGVFRQLQEWGIDAQQEKTILDFKNKIPGIVTNAVGPVVGMLSSVFLVLIFVAFLLAGRNPYAIRTGVRADTDQKIRRYIVIKVAISAVTGFLVWLSLALIKLKLAGVFGILAFLLNFIPSIGSIIATLLPIPIAAAQFQSPWPIVYVVAVPGIIQNVIGNIIDPKIMGDELNLHPITVLLALSFWGLLWGITGMFLATPITAVLRIVLMQFDTFKPIGKLLAGDFSTPEKPAG